MVEGTLVGVVRIIIVPALFPYLPGLQIFQESSDLVEVDEDAFGPYGSVIKSPQYRDLYTLSNLLESCG